MREVNRLKWKISKLEAKINSLDGEMSKLKRNLIILERKSKSADKQIHIQWERKGYFS